MFLNLLIFIGIIALVVFVCRRNLKSRTEELKNNLSKFNENIITYYNSMSDKEQENFFNTADSKVIENLKRLIENRYIYGNNVWSIQQQIAEQQTLLVELNKLCRKD